MEGEANGAHGQSHGQLVGGWWSPASTDVMSQLCRVCGEPAAGFHFGAFTCEGCKSFFGRTYNNLGSITECKNQGACVINKKNRTSCKACRLRKCLLVGMSKSGSRYGRRSNWFKIHCLLQEQQHQHQQQQQQHGEQQPPRREPQVHQVHPPRTSPPEKSPKGSSQGPGMGLGPRLEGLYGGGMPPMLWAGPRGLLPPPPPHGPPLGLSFPPFLPAAAAAAAAAFNGGVAPPLFGLPPPGAAPQPPAASQRLDWGRLASPPSSPPPRLHLHTKTAPAVPQPLRGPPPGGLGRPSPPRLDEGDDADQEQPMDLSRTASSHRRAPTPPSAAAQGRRRQDDCADKDDGSDSGVSERDDDRAADGDPEADSPPPPRLSPRPSPCPSLGRPPSPATVPVDLSLS